MGTFMDGPGSREMKPKKLLSEVTGGLSFVILYGSQLGQAKSIAEGLSESAGEHDLQTMAMSLNLVKDIAELKEINIPIVIVTSTTGDGEAPENADKFFRKLRKKSLSSKTLNSVRYSILGLGDTNFNNFCNCGKTIHKRFQELGATLFYPEAWADDAVGLDKTVEEWIEGLWPMIKKSLGIDPRKMSILAMPSTESSMTVPSCPQPIIELKYVSTFGPGSGSNVDLLSPPAPYPSTEGGLYSATVSSSRYLTKAGAVKTGLEVTLTLLSNQKEFDFEPGDAIGIICPNPGSEVEALLKRLNVLGRANETLEITLIQGAKGRIPLHIPRKSTLWNIFTHYLDIRTTPKKAFFRILAESAQSAAEKKALLELCSKEAGTKFEECIRFPGLSILDILLKYPSCQPRLESFIEHLPRLIPRAYSIASSPYTSKTSFRIAFNIVQIPDGNGRMYSRQGLCTGWLHELAKLGGFVADETSDLAESLKKLSVSVTTNSLTQEILFYKRKNHFFRLPKNLNAPIIMVGPGAGVAPFIGFIEHRQHQKVKGQSIGPLTLYFGCRHKSKDFIYEEVLEKSLIGGVLTDLHVAFSRDANEHGAKYVQDLMAENQERIVSTILNNGGYLYVCGDAKNMAKSVREKLISLIAGTKGLSEKEATEAVGGLVTSKRYLQDIWT